VNYQFPQNITIDEVRSIIAKKPEFKENFRPGFSVFNYNVAFTDTFPAVVDRDTAILRELRGLIFNTVSGRVISRRFHKFFNLNEREETAMDNVDWKQPYWIMEKLDGSMVTPYENDKGVIRWFSKAGDTFIADQIEAHFNRLTSKKDIYEKFARDMFERGITPIFEWCTPLNRIVVDYPVSVLILIAMRWIDSGEYVTPPAMKNYAEEYDIPCVKFYEPKEMSFAEIDEWRQKSVNITGEEGIIIRFQDGHMLKVKTDWYLALHKTKAHMEQEKNVVELILTGQLDDLLAVVSPEDYDFLTKYSANLHAKINNTVSELMKLVKAVSDSGMTRKEFAINLAPNYPGFFRKEIFANFEVLSFLTEEALTGNLFQYILNHTSTKAKLASVKADLKWTDLDYMKRYEAEE
jgi:RNA ligase